MFQNSLNPLFQILSYTHGTRATVSESVSRHCIKKTVQKNGFSLKMVFRRRLDRSDIASLQVRLGLRV